MAWNGRDLDRWFLGPVDGPAFDSIAHALQSRLTDSAIAAAVATLPEPWRATDGPRLEHALRSRREYVIVLCAGSHSYRPFSARQRANSSFASGEGG